MHPIRQWSIMEPPSQSKNCILGLAGRSNPSEPMMELCADFGLRNTLVAGVRAAKYAWYPQPISSHHQAEAVKGLISARKEVEKAVKRIKCGWHIKQQEIVLVGFSAGAVMAIYTAMHSKAPFKAVVALAGAILEPDKIPECRHPGMPIILQHNMDDMCFDWYERYIPMRDGLTQKGYNVLTIERAKGGHSISYRDAVSVGEFLAPMMGYGEGWTHPGVKALWHEREQEAFSEFGSLARSFET